MSDSLHPQELVHLGNPPDAHSVNPPLDVPTGVGDASEVPVSADTPPAQEADHIDLGEDSTVAVDQAVEAGTVHWDAESMAGTEPTATSGVRLLGGRRKGRRLVKREEASRSAFTPEQRLLILDSWQRSGLPAGDFATLVGLSKHTLFGWKKRFKEQGPA